MSKNDCNSKKNINSQFFNQNENLIKLVFDFCSPEDILSLSLVCKRFYYITKSLDYKFISSIEKEFFSNYEGYS